MRCGVLEGLEGLVHLETLRKVLSGLGVEVVVCQTANASRIHVSAGLDGRGISVWRAYSRVCKVEFVLSISVMAMIPSAV